MQAEHDAERRRRHRRRYANALRQAALHADAAELDELERLVRAERLGVVKLRDAHASVLDLLRAQNARRP